MPTFKTNLRPRRVEVANTDRGVHVVLNVVNVIGATVRGSQSTIAAW